MVIPPAFRNEALACAGRRNLFINSAIDPLIPKEFRDFGKASTSSG